MDRPAAARCSSSAFMYGSTACGSSCARKVDHICLPWKNGFVSVSTGGSAAQST